MPAKDRFVHLILVLGVLAAPATLTGCMTHQRYYDNDHHDYHRWSGVEVGFYQRWENDGHRDHRDFDQRSADEQRDYWNWRHEHQN